MKEAGPARGLFWEQLLSSNGLVRATLTFPSQEEGRIGEGRGGGGRITALHTHRGWRRRGPAGCRNSASGWGLSPRGNFSSLKTDWGPLHPTPFTALLKLTGCSHHGAPSREQHGGLNSHQQPQGQEALLPTLSPTLKVSCSNGSQYHCHNSLNCWTKCWDFFLYPEVHSRMGDKPAPAKY